MKIFFSSFFLLIFSYLAVSQIIEKPNFSSASHPMVVERIEFSENQTIVTLSIENQSENGYFCADKNIYLIESLSNKKHKLIKSIDIPVCPETYKFKAIGEKLQFQLFFPKILYSNNYVNILEDCSQNCFNIAGIVLDNGTNKEIDLAFSNYSEGKTELALSIFLQITKNHPDYLFGNIYTNIIQIYAENNDFTNAKKWYKKLNDSTFQDKTESINRLKQFSYFTKLIF